LVDEGLVGESEWVKKYYYYKNENESKTWICVVGWLPTWTKP
jgi:hypothetical protein